MNSGDPTLELLSAAAVALEQGRHRACVEHLRDAWRATHDPELAELYELLLREFQAPALAGRNPVERAASWIERARQNSGDPLELPLLLADYRLDTTDRGKRLRLLAAWSPDPALASALATDLRVSMMHRKDSDLYWPEQVALLDAQADPRQLPTLERILVQPVLRAELRGQARRVHDSLVGVRPTRSSPAARATATRIERRAGHRRSFEQRSAELLAAVHAAPDADEPRLVYADWLAGHGDPRGEFISLQVERARSGGATTARERELLERHANEWSGSLNRLLGERGFERGFVALGSVEVDDLDGELVDLPDWSTLRVLDGKVSDALVRRGRLDHLRELYGYHQLERFVAARADNRLGAVERYECSLRDRNIRLDTPLWLRSLLVRHALDDALRELIRSPAIAELEQLGVYYGSGPSYFADHREHGEVRHRVELLRARLPVHIRELRLLDHSSTARASRPKGWCLLLERDELDRFSRLRADWWQPAGNRVGTEAVAQLLESLAGLDFDVLEQLTLGHFDDPARELALERLRALSDRLKVEG